MFLAASLTSRFLLVMKMIDVAFKFENGSVPLKFFLVQNVQQPKKYRALNHGLRSTGPTGPFGRDICTHKDKKASNLDVNVCSNVSLL